MFNERKNDKKKWICLNFVMELKNFSILRKLILAISSLVTLNRELKSTLSLSPVLRTCPQSTVRRLKVLIMIVQKMST